MWAVQLVITFTFTWDMRIFVDASIKDSTGLGRLHYGGRDFHVLGTRRSRSMLQRYKWGPVAALPAKKLEDMLGWPASHSIAPAP